MAAWYDRRSWSRCVLFDSIIPDREVDGRIVWLVHARYLDRVSWNTCGSSASDLELSTGEVELDTIVVRAMHRNVLGTHEILTRLESIRNGKLWPILSPRTPCLIQDGSILR